MKTRLRKMNVPIKVLGSLLIFSTSCTSPQKQSMKASVGTPQETETKTVSLMGKRGIVKHSFEDELKPFQNSYLTLPANYTGPSFELKHDYPEHASKGKKHPWKAVTKDGRITKKNANDYVLALKEYVSADMEKMLFDYENWNQKKAQWWESIWLGSQREPIHGMYVGSGFAAHTLSPQQVDLTTFVFTLYDRTSAVTLNNIWGTDLKNAEQPNLSSAEAAQFAEGSVIIKYAFVTADGEQWPDMDGAATWTIYTDVDPATGAPTGNQPQMMDLSLMQFDIIVKDSKAAPETGWVFSTLVYDKDAPGKNAWDKMVPLGATWGDNPDIISVEGSAVEAPVKVNKMLSQNWINMNTPDYTRSTLGWDGRLSGPNDGAVVNNATTTTGVKYDNLASAGCLGCHSSAQYTFESFLLPGYTDDNGLTMYNPGSDEWMKWFQNRDGKLAMDPGKGQIGLDYDMVTAFKAIPLWQEAMDQKNTVLSKK